MTCHGTTCVAQVNRRGDSRNVLFRSYDPLLRKLPDDRYDRSPGLAAGEYVTLVLYFAFVVGTIKTMDTTIENGSLVMAAMSLLPI